MRNLKAWQKLVLIGAVSMVPFAVVTYKMASSINTLGVEFARQEIRGLEYLTPLSSLLKNLQLHRGLVTMPANSGMSSTRPLDAIRLDISRDLKRMDEVDQRLGGCCGLVRYGPSCAARFWRSSVGLHPHPRRRATCSIRT